MPRKYYKKKTPYRPRRRRFKRKKNFISNKLSPMPLRFASKMKYYTTVSINPSVGTVAKHVFAANGLYDPDITGGGHQPRIFDEMMALYNHYTVVGSRIKVTFFNSDANIPVVCGIMVSTDATSSTELQDYIEQGNVRYAVVGGDTHGSGSLRTLTATGSPKKAFGVAKIMDNSNLKGYVSGNPAELLYYNVFCCAQNESSDPSSVDCTVEIEYLAVFTEPTNLQAS